MLRNFLWQVSMLRDLINFFLWKQTFFFCSFVSFYFLLFAFYYFLYYLLFFVYNLTHSFFFITLITFPIFFFCFQQTYPVSLPYVFKSLFCFFNKMCQIFFYFIFKNLIFYSILTLVFNIFYTWLNKMSLFDWKNSKTKHKKAKKQETKNWK